MFAHKCVLAGLTVAVTLAAVVILSFALSGCGSVQVVPTRPTLYDAPQTQIDVDSWPTCAIEGYAAAMDEMTFGVAVIVREECIADRKGL